MARTPGRRGPIGPRRAFRSPSGRTRPSRGRRRHPAVGGPPGQSALSSAATRAASARASDSIAAKVSFSGPFHPSNPRGSRVRPRSVHGDGRARRSCLRLPVTREDTVRRRSRSAPVRSRPSVSTEFGPGRRGARRGRVRVRTSVSSGRRSYRRGRELSVELGAPSVVQIAAPRPVGTTRAAEPIGGPRPAARLATDRTAQVGREYRSTLPTHTARSPSTVPPDREGLSAPPFVGG